MKSKGAITIEAAILTPILFLSLLLIIDISLNVYIKSSIKSVFSNSLNSFENELKANSDKNIKLDAKYDFAPDFIIQNALNSSMLDNMHLGLDTNIIKGRISKYIVEKTFLKKGEFSLNVTKNSLLFSSTIKVSMVANINTPLSGFYKKLGIDMGVLKISDSVVIKDYFFSISLINSLSRMIAKNKNIASLLDKLNNVAFYIYKIIGG